MLPGLLQNTKYRTFHITTTDPFTWTDHQLKTEGHPVLF
jgi:hypothetical protein